MIYRTYGRTGVSVSAIGFGGMRFAKPDDTDACAALVRAAYDAGINYFDTAPGYGRSEEIFGAAFQSMKRSRARRPFHVATKSFGGTPADLRRDLETSLSRMGLDAIDFFHVWCVMDPADWRERVDGGVLKECERMRDEGLVRHVCVSSHMTGADIRAMLAEHDFEGLLLGYSVSNFAYREEGLAAAAERGLGVAVMNPLAGGVIPQNRERFDFVRTRPDETVAEAALRFLLNDPRITLALVGFAREEEIREAARAVDGFRPIPADAVGRIRSGLRASFDGLCTGCRYCEPCPAGIPVPKEMDAYNQYLLGGTPEKILDRLHWHWGIEAADEPSSTCTDCGACEERCTQKLPIRERLRAIGGHARRRAAARNA